MIEPEATLMLISAPQVPVMSTHFGHWRSTHGAARVWPAVAVLFLTGPGALHLPHHLTATHRWVPLTSESVILNGSDENDEKHFDQTKTDLE